MEISRAA